VSFLFRDLSLLIFLFFAPSRCPQVAFSTPANAAPYLYAVPNSLACFSNLLKHFNVRPSFGSSDFAAVLRRMAVETGAAGKTSSTEEGEGAKSTVSGGAAGGGTKDDKKLDGMQGSVQALTPSQLDLALSLVQVLSDDRIRVKDFEVSVHRGWTFIRYELYECE